MSKNLITGLFLTACTIILEACKSKHDQHVMEETIDQRVQERLAMLEDHEDTEEE